MNNRDEEKTHERVMDGDRRQGGRFTRFYALGDSPGHPTGCTIRLSNGDLLLFAAHPHSTLILHAVGQRGGRSAK